MSAIGNKGVKSSTPIGFPVTGFRAGGGGVGKSEMMLNQACGMRVSGSRKLVVSFMSSLQFRFLIDEPTANTKILSYIFP